MTRYLLAFPALALLIACNGDDPADSGVEADADTDTDADSDTDADTDSDTDTDVEFTGGFFEFLSGQEVEEATITAGDVVTATDADGFVTLSYAPNTDIEILFEHEDFRDFYIYNHIGAEDYAINYLVPATGTIAGLGAIMGITIDTSKAIVSVSVRDGAPASSDYVEGVTIDLDAAYDVALIFDEAANTGLAAGNTTLEGEQSTVIFVNVEAGDLTPVITHPDEAATCTLGSETFNAPAGSYAISSLFCSVEGG